MNALHSSALGSSPCTPSGQGEPANPTTHPGSGPASHRPPKLQAARRSAPPALPPAPGGAQALVVPEPARGGTLSLRPTPDRAETAGAPP
ncbi:Hypothetical predicted protein [Marmota monax]|uniref:Uncharacterized protein n=1 Tax=Marmota monax TaxID=9995 RepID=A0A5E4B839_MARMO|nr:hypothetical protein GHT09_013593 [Marmota monax]VTJ65823.1 Hypothetical predicted protein [Marmota monax]